ncbi:sugar transferase [Thioclava sp. BHET1]|nr:sugar transferase [Thioclava sp. BHET1]
MDEIVAERKRYEDISAAPSLRGHLFYKAWGKRTLDLFLILMILPVVMPVVALLWVVVRLDGGPGFFGQERVGRNGTLFTCWKLRTMRVDAESVLAEICASDPIVAREWHENQKLANDPRITRIGHFLRKSSLDELPQIFNILMGEMSFVGPRPFMTNQEHLYTKAGGEAYFSMRPGVTGPWQIDGRSATRFVDRIRFDEDYYQKMSLQYDLQLVMRTAGVVVKLTGR